MLNIQKASLLTDGNQVTLTMPISKIDAEKRIVSGFATLDNIDKQGDRVDSSASEKAFANFRGNVRLMHQPIPAGKIVSFRTDSFFDPETQKTYNGVYVDAYISKGASDVWEMVLDGTLTGFSIGGAVKDSDTEFDELLDKTVRVIKEYDLVELSLVDSPANQFANIFSIQKTIDGDVATGIFNKSHIQNVFWCEQDDIAFTSSDDKYTCVSCNNDLTAVGWVDELEKADVEKAINNLISIIKDTATGAVTNNETINRYPKQNPYKSKKKPEEDMTKAGSYSTGDFVQWGSSGGTARGKITRVVTNGKIKVPNSSFSITGTKEDPAVVIRVYQKDGNSWKPSQTLVGHKMSTLNSWTVKMKKFFNPSEEEILLNNDSVDMAINKDMSVATQNNEGGVEMTDDTNATEIAEEVIVDEIVETEEVAVEAAEEVPAEDTAVEAAVEVDEEIVEETADAVNASTDSGEATDLEKTLNEIKNFVGEALVKNANANVEAVSNVASTLAEVTKALTEKLTETENRYEELNKGLAEVTKTLTQVNGRLESVEDDTAVKKSGELDSSPEVTIEKSESLWGGRFLGSAQYLN